MSFAFSRRGLLMGAAAVAGTAQGGPLANAQARRDGWVSGLMSGAAALVEALVAEGVGCVYGIPGAQENEIWDALKERHVPYLLATHEYSAACMADGYARSTGKPGVLAVVPGPGVTNALTGLGEALLDSVPLVAIVGDVANGAKFRPFQVHCLNTIDLLKPVCKAVYPVQTVDQIAATVRQAFAAAACGEPGPVAVVVPYNLLIEWHTFHTPPVPPPAPPFDEAAFQKALALLTDPKHRVGIYAGMGCMAYSDSLAAVAELLQAPVATSVSGKGAMNENHPLAVGWGFGPHASEVAETVFARDLLHPLKTGVTTLLAIGVKFSEVSTGFYGNPQPPHVIHVDANPNNLARILRTDVSVHGDAGVFLGRLLACAPAIRRATDHHLHGRIRTAKAESARELASVPPGKNGIDPLALVGAIRRAVPDDGLFFVDVTVSEHLAAEHYRVCRPRTYFNPTDNQSMGWSVGASIGAQKAHPGRCVAALIGDGSLLMSAMELSTAARAGLPVKFFVIDDRSYQFMQQLQEPAFMRTTATVLAKIDYRALAAALGLAYQDIDVHGELDARVRGALCHPGPVLVRVGCDYDKRPIRWISAVRQRFIKELNAGQKARFLARLAGRAIRGEKQND